WIYRSSIADLVGKVPKFTYSDRVTNIAYINTTDMKEKDYEAVVGFYTLNISNDYDYVIVKTRVRLQLQRQSEPDKSSDTWIFLLIIGILLLTISFFLLYKMFQKQQLEFYN
ncbi:neurofascin, partial [Biomphalaria glabrata]